MVMAKVTSKGQITIPAVVRAKLGLNTGSKLEFVELQDGEFAIVAATNSVQSLKGMLRKPAAPVSVEQMHEAIAKYGAKAK